MNSLRTLGACILLSMAAPLSASPIFYEITNIGGDRWQYDYTLGNDTTALIDSFTIFFALDTFANLTLVSSPTNWDSLVADPDPNLPDDGFFDTYDLDFLGINPGESLSGFSVSFDFLGIGTPGSQAFDANPFGNVISGFTQLAPGDPISVPEPDTWFLLSAGLAVLLLRRRQRPATAFPPRA